MKIPAVTPNTRCKLRALRLERIKDFLLLEEEFVDNMIDHRRNIRFLEKQIRNLEGNKDNDMDEPEVEDEDTSEEYRKAEALRELPLTVNTLEEIIDENHAIVSESYGPET